MLSVTLTSGVQDHWACLEQGIVNKGVIELHFRYHELNLASVEFLLPNELKKRDATKNMS